jgi:hypothetical protein
MKLFAVILLVNNVWGFSTIPVKSQRMNNIITTALYMAKTRRSILEDTIKVSILCRLMLTSPNTLLAAAPSAALDALLPATRVKRSIERSIKLVHEAKEGSTDALEELKRIILEPQHYTKSLKLQGVPEKPADLYLESYRSMKGDLPFQQYLVRNGDVNTWKNLKRKEKEMESANEIRAAFNAYTDALLFSGDMYLLNVNKTTRSKMVREEKLPPVKEVINSDMGMRYLYRNEVLSAMDEVKAELEYQVSYQDDGIRLDLDELLRLLQLAKKACDDWFDLIDPSDVKQAYQILDMEQKS